MSAAGESSVDSDSRNILATIFFTAVCMVAAYNKMSMITILLQSPTLSMSTKMKILVGVVVVFLLLIGGCNVFMRSLGRSMVERAIESASNGQADVKIGDDGKMEVKTKDGSFTTGTELSADWPKDVPVYPESTVVFSGSGMGDEGQNGVAAVFQSDDASTDVTSKYKEDLKAQGWTIGTTMQGNGASIFVATKDTRTLSVSIGSSEGKTSITLGVQTK